MNEESFWAKVDKSGECWIWRGARSATAPYGVVNTWGVKTTTAHRWIYERLHGELPRKIVVHHKCGTKLCVRPDHLQAVTNSENLLFERKDICPNGHPWSSENTYDVHAGERHCRVCGRERARKVRQERKEKGLTARGTPFTELGLKRRSSPLSSRAMLSWWAIHMIAAPATLPKSDPTDT